MVRVTWTATSLRQLEDIRVYIGRDSQFQAKRVCLQIRDSVRKLREHPNYGAKVPEFADATIREIRIYQYRIVYQFNEEDELARVLAVVHGARKLTKDLLEPV